MINHAFDDDKTIYIVSDSDCAYNTGGNNYTTSEISTQTDVKPSTIRSWKIQRTSDTFSASSFYSKENKGHVSLMPDGSEVFILESRGVGFNASTQTLDDEIFHRSKQELRGIITSWRVLTILLPSLVYITLFFLNQLLDTLVCSEFCRDTNDWLCGLSLIFLIGPSIVINVYAYDQLTKPDVATIKPVTKKFGRILCFMQVTPYYLMGRRMVWSIKAWAWGNHREERIRILSRELWDKAALENDSMMVKLFQSLLESFPQSSLQSYVLLTTLGEMHMFGDNPPSTILWISVFVNLLSASLGMASSYSENMFERFAGTVAIFTTLGSRAMICGGIGTIHPGLWIIPLLASFLIGFVTKVSESVDMTVEGHLRKLKKYVSEAFIMASVCPPFDPTGFFCSVVYVLSAVVFFVKSPANPINATSLVFATVGQTIWVSVGFCLLRTPPPQPKFTQIPEQQA